MSKMEYGAVKHLDFYYLVETPIPDDLREKMVVLTEVEYNKFLEMNQKYFYVIRKSKGVLISCKEERPTQFHVWNETIGDWQLNSEDLLKTHKMERSSLIQEAIILKDIDPEEHNRIREEIAIKTKRIKELESVVI